MLALLRSWPADIYRAKVVLASVQAAADADAAPTDVSSGALAHFARLECEAVLLCGVGAPERALDILIKLPSASVDVFAFVEQHKLHGFLRDKARSDRDRAEIRARGSTHRAPQIAPQTVTSGAGAAPRFALMAAHVRAARLAYRRAAAVRRRPAHTRRRAQAVRVPACALLAGARCARDLREMKIDRGTTLRRHLGLISA